MKRILYYIVCAAFLTQTVSCHRGPQTIPEKTLRPMMRELLVSQAILQVDRSGRSDLLPTDSTDIHTPILKRYGYTLDDLRHTIRELSMRKSNPLANILTDVAEEIKVSRIDAERRYREMLRIDSIAQARTADTVFRSDTVLSGRLDGLRIAYTGPVASDSAVPAGTYRIGFDYSTGPRARSYTKSVRTKRTKRNGQTSESTLWLPPATDTTDYQGEVTVGNEVKSMEITISETLRKDMPQDTCYLTNLRVVYIHPVSRARTLLQRQLTGFPENLEEYYEKRYYDSLLRRFGEEAGGPVPPRAGR